MLSRPRWAVSGARLSPAEPEYSRALFPLSPHNRLVGHGVPLQDDYIKGASPLRRAVWPASTVPVADGIISAYP